MNNSTFFHQNAKIVKYSLLFVSGKKAILSFEWCACFDSKKRCGVDRVRCSFLSDRSLSKHSSEHFTYLLVIDVVRGSYFGI